MFGAQCIDRGGTDSSQLTVMNGGIVVMAGRAEQRHSLEGTVAMAPQAPRCPHHTFKARKGRDIC